MMMTRVLDDQNVRALWASPYRTPRSILCTRPSVGIVFRPLGQLSRGDTQLAGKKKLRTSVMVKVLRPVELTPAQVELLKFFGGILDAPPSGSTCATLDVLKRQGLVRLEPKRERFTISKIGRGVLAELMEEGKPDPE